MNTEYYERLVSYRTAMSLAEGMLFRGIITERDYTVIDRKIASKYGLSLSSICCQKPLITKGFRANMTPAEKGGEVYGTNDKESPIQYPKDHRC